MKETYKKGRTQSQDDQWPPNQPKVVVNLAFIHAIEEQTEQKFIQLSTHKISSLCSDHPRVFKTIPEIFRSSSKKSILIEGAPGIGKTILAKEIAYCWAIGDLFKGRKLFLLFLRDPELHSIASIEDLVNHLGHNYLSKSEVTDASNYLKKIQGLGIVFVIDGYDECPCHGTLKRFIGDLFKHKILQKCIVVITSRPTASLDLHALADQRNEILGLAKREQDEYIAESLKESPHMKTELQEYLKHQPMISSLMYIPLHLAILLYLLKQNMLPNTLTEMNEYFVVHTIYRHLKKSSKGSSLIKIKKITDLPNPEKTTVHQLSELAFKGIIESQLIFTLDEVKKVCPKVVDDIPGAINGFGLLQTVESYYQKGAGKTVSFNFLHLTMQEYLAALHISALPEKQQSSLINLMFSRNWFTFMWKMYVGIVGLESTFFNDMVNCTLKYYKDNKLAIIFMLNCYLEGKYLNDIPSAIISIFHDGNIDLSNVPLLPHSVASLIFIMMKSPIKWKSLNLSNCIYNHEGIRHLTALFINFKEKFSTIQSINLSKNYLTSLWEPDVDNKNIPETALLLAHSLDLSCNNLNNNETEKLFWALHSSKKLKNLNLSQNSIQINSTIAIYDCLKVNNTIHELDVSLNYMSDEGAEKLAKAIQVNATLQKLDISKNWISTEGVWSIIKAFTKQRTLDKLVCTHNNLLKSDLAEIIKYIESENSIQIFDASWNTVTTKHRRLVIKTVFCLSDLQQKHKSRIDDVKGQEELWCVDKFTEQTTHILQNCFEEYLNDHKVVSLQNIRLQDFEIKILSDCLKSSNTLTDLDLSNNAVVFIYDSPYVLNHNAVEFISAALKSNWSLCRLNLSGNNIVNNGVKILAKAVTFNAALQRLDLSYNQISDDGVLSFAELFVKNQSLNELNLSQNLITDQGIKGLGGAIEVNKTLLELDISRNRLSKLGIMKIVKACAINKTLKKLVCTHNNLSKSGLVEIIGYIKKKNAIQIFDASWNSVRITFGELSMEANFHLLDLEHKLESNDRQDRQCTYYIDETEYLKEFVYCCLEDEETIDLQGTGDNEMSAWPYKQSISSRDAIITNHFKILGYCIKMHKALTNLIVSNCKITDEQLQILTEAIKVNKTLQYLDFSLGNISDKGVIFISNCLNDMLCALDLACNQITDNGVETLTKAISTKTSLQKLDLSSNMISDEGILFLCDFLNHNESLNELNLSGNTISNKGIQKLNEAIQDNNKLELLNVSKNLISFEGVMGLLEACTKSRTLQKLVFTHNNLSKFELATIIEYNRKENAVKILDASYNSIIARDGKLSIKTTLDTQQNLNNRNAQKDMWYLDEVTELKYKAQVLHCCFTECFNEQDVSLQDVHISNFEAEILSSCFKLNNLVINLNLSGCFQKCSPVPLSIFISNLSINNTLCSLNFSNNLIGDINIESLTKAVISNATLQKLNLAHNNISDNGIFFIYNYLKINNTLWELNLSKNNITTKGAKALAKAIQVNAALQKLNISRNWIDKGGVMRIIEACAQNKTLQNLVCTHNNLSKLGFGTIIKYIRERSALQRFDASWNTIHMQNNHLDIIVTFQSLDLKQDLQDCIHKTQLMFMYEIPSFKLRREFLNCCLENEQLVNLQSRENAVIEIFIDCFKMNKTLMELKLPSINKLSSKSIKKLAVAIQVNKTLQILDISDNTLYSNGITALINCLKINNTVRKLNVSRNSINDDTTELLAEVVQENTILQELNISKNLISEKGIMNILEACTMNRTLQKIVCTHNNLSKVELATIIEYIEEENAVQIFDASWNSIGVKLGKLAIKTTLLLLNMNQCKPQLDVIAQEDWYVDEITELEYRKKFLFSSFESDPAVDLHGIIATEDCLEFKIIKDHLKRNSKLCELILSSSMITDDTTKDISEAVVRNPTLQNLDISCNRITDVGISAIRGCLMNNSVLRKLNLSNNFITDIGAQKLCEAIKTNKILEELSVCKNWISQEGITTMVKACNINRTLHKLVCAGNNISKSELEAINQYIITENAVQIFSSSWNSICTLNNTINIRTTFQLLDIKQEIPLTNGNTQEELWCLDKITKPEYRKDFLRSCFNECLNKDVFNLCNTRITNFEAGVLSDCFQSNYTLVELHLSNCFTDSNVELLSAISDFLERNSTLRKLNLSGNRITDDEIEKLSKAIAINVTLDTLDMSCNVISDGGILFLSNHLKHNKGLLKLILSKNDITDEGAMHLAAVIQTNVTLQELNLSKNCITKDGVIKILEACTKSRVLQKIVCTHSLSKSDVRTINEYLDCCKENQLNILFVASWNTICTKGARLSIKTNLLVNQESQPAADDDDDDDNIEYNTSAACKRRWNLLLQGCFEEYLNKQSINLEDIEINDIEMKIICSCLENNSVLVDLNISNYNKFTNVKLDDILSISQCLKKNSTLRKLNLSRNHITNEGASHLAEALLVNETLQVLNISDNMIGYGGIIGIVKACTKHRTLYELVCIHNNLLKCQLFDISENIKKEKVVQRFEASWCSLCIKNNKLGVETTVQALQLSNSSVYKASYYVSRFTERRHCELELFVYCLMEYTIVYSDSLCLQNALITKDEIIFFAFFPKINELTLSKCIIDAIGLRVAINTCLNTLSILNLSRNKITDDELKHFAEVVTATSTLKNLDLSHNLISNYGVLSFAECLENNKTLQKLNLAGNAIADVGAKKLARIIQKNTGLLELNISKNWLSKEGLMDLAKACTMNKTLCRLVCTHNNLSKFDFIAISREYTKIEKVIPTIEASWNSICDTEDKLAITTTLQSLQSESDEIQTEMWYLDDISSLYYRTQLLLCCLEEYLDKQSSKAMEFSNYEIEFPDDFEDHECLRINGTLINLSSCKLISYWLTCNAATVSTVLQKLDLSNFLIFDDGISIISCCLKTNRTLKELNLAGIDFTNKGAKDLADAIQINSTLQELDISENLISKEGVSRIVEAYTESSVLYKLVCKSNNLSKSEVTAIKKYIRNKNVVKYIAISWNNIVNIDNKLAIETIVQLLDTQKSCDSDVTCEPAVWYLNRNINQKYKREVLNCCFKDYLNEQSVSLQSIQMTNFEIEMFSDCLKANGMLIELNLSDFSIANDYWVDSTDDCLEIDDAVDNLDFSEKLASNNTVEVLTEALATNITLQKLNLSRNIIFDNGVSLFRNCFKINATLCELILSSNYITDDEIKGLAELVPINVTLQVLDLSKNYISKKGVLMILDACVKHKTLQKVICTHNNLSKSGLAAINEYIKKNNAVQIFDASWNGIGTNHGKLTINTTFQLLDVNKQLEDNKRKQTWYLNEITKEEHKIEFLECCLESEHCVNLQAVGMADYFEVGLITCCLKSNKTLVELILSKSRITDKVAGNLATAIKANITLRNVDVSRNIITDNGISIIAGCLKNNTILRKLNLSSNNITDEGAKGLAKAIRVNKKLQELSISKNMISKEGVMSIVEACTKYKTLHKLVCTHNNLSKPGLAAIIEYIKDEDAVQIFDASSNSLGTKHGSLVIVTIFQLLDVNQNLLHETKKEFWYMNEITNMEYRREFLHCCLESECSVNLQGICMTDYFEIIIDCLKVNKSLFSLNLSNNGIGKINKGAEKLANCLKVNKTLTELNLSNNGIHNFDKGAEKLAEVITTNKVLQNLDISSNRIYCETFSSCLKLNKALTKLNVSDNGIGDCGAMDLAEFLKENTTLLELDISKNWISENGVMGILKACTVSKILLKLVCTYNNLSKPELSKINKYIEVENAVQLFDVSWSRSIATCELEYPTESFNIVVFQTLRLSDNGDWEIIYFNKKTEAYLNSHGKSDDNLGIQYHFTDDELDELTFLPAVLSPKVLLYFIQEVMQIDTLKKLNISGNKISDDGAVSFSKWFKTNKTLIELDMSENGVSCSGVKAIAEVIRINYTLLKLNLSHNEIFNDGAIALSKCLKINATLIDLDVSFNNITGQGAMAIVKVMKVNTTLKKLNISANEISEDVATALCESLKCNVALKELNMSRDYFTCTGANAIAEAIKENTNLESLTICNVGMKASSCMYGHSFNMTILTALYCNDQISELTISMPFSIEHYTILVGEFEKINNERRKKGVSTVKFNCIDDYY